MRMILGWEHYYSRPRWVPLPQGDDDDDDDGD